MPTPVLTYTLGFTLNQDQTVGSMTLTDTTDWASYGLNPADIEISWGYNGPDGNPYFVAAVGSTWSIFPAISTSASLPLPLSMGVIQTGDYTIYTNIYSAVGPVDVDGGPDTHNLCTDFPTLCLETPVDCNRLIVAATDATGWAAGWTVNSRSMRLEYPSVQYHADITGAGPTISTNGDPIWNGTWTASATVNVTKGNYTVTLTTTKQFQVTCNLDGCRIQCMFKTVYANLQRAFYPDNPSLRATILNQLSRMTTLAVMIENSIACGDDTFVSNLMTEFKILATGKPDGGDCSCCDDCSEPQPLTPIGGGGGAVSVVAGLPYISVTNVGTVYTVGTTQALQDQLDWIQQYAFTSTDGTVDITASLPAGSPPTVTVDLSVNNPATDSMQFTWTITPGVGESLSTPIIVGDLFSAAGLTITATGGGFYAVPGFYAVTGFFTGAPFPIEARVSVGNVVRKGFYVATERYGILVSPDKYTSGGNFTIGLKAAGNLFLTNNGQAKDISFFARYITSMEIFVTIVKKQ